MSKKNGKEKELLDRRNKPIKSYLIPTSSPWVLVINDDRYVIASTVARLLEKLWKENKSLKAKLNKKGK